VAAHAALGVIDFLPGQVWLFLFHGHRWDKGGRAPRRKTAVGALAATVGATAVLAGRRRGIFAADQRQHGEDQ
jgi:hypothetical protein